MTKREAYRSRKNLCYGASSYANLNTLGLDARDFDVRRESDTSVMLIFNSRTSALGGLQTLSVCDIQDATQQEPYEFIRAESFSEVQTFGGKWEA